MRRPTMDFVDLLGTGVYGVWWYSKIKNVFFWVLNKKDEAIGIVKTSRLRVCTESIIVDLYGR